MRKPLTRKVEGQLPLATMDPKAWEKLPLLRGFFLDATYADDGAERQPGCIILRADSQRWSVTLKDPTSCQQLYLGAPTLSDLWKLVEAALGDEQSPWTIDKWAADRAPRQRPKRG